MPITMRLPYTATLAARQLVQQLKCSPLHKMRFDVDSSQKLADVVQEIRPSLANGFQRFNAKIARTQGDTTQSPTSLPKKLRARLETMVHEIVLAGEDRPVELFAGYLDSLPALNAVKPPQGRTTKRSNALAMAFIGAGVFLTAIFATGVLVHIFRSSQEKFADECVAASRSNKKYTYYRDGDNNNVSFGRLRDGYYCRYRCGTEASIHSYMKEGHSEELSIELADRDCRDAIDDFFHSSRAWGALHAEGFSCNRDFYGQTLWCEKPMKKPRKK